MGWHPATSLRFTLPEGAPVSLVIYDLAGREVARLVDSYTRQGYYQAQWSGKDQSSRSVSSGIYIARLVTPEYSKSIKIVLLK